MSALASSMSTQQHADTLISSWFSSSIIYLAIGPRHFKDRLARFLTTKVEADYYFGHDANRAIIQFMSCLATYSPMLPNKVRQTCIAFHTDLFAGVDYSSAVQHNNLWHFIFDVVSPCPQLVIPMHLFIPYAHNAPARTDAELARTDMIPHFFITTSGNVGVPLHGAADQLDPTRQFREQRTSLKVRFGWPGYAPHEGQIQYNSTPGSGRTVITSRRLAQLVSGQVVSFISKVMEGSIARRERTAFSIGRHHGQIQAQDIILLGVISVSQGAIMPLLQLRPDFHVAAH